MRVLMAFCVIFTYSVMAEEKPEKAGPASPAPAKKQTATKGQDANEEELAPSDEQEEDRVVNLDNEDAFIDLSDALKSKHFVRRAILNTAIQSSSRFHLGRPYVNHLVGFNAIIQKTGKSMYAMQSIAGGYVFPFGLGAEMGFEFSALSSLFLGVRYVFDQASAFVWPYLGLGMIREIESLAVSDVGQELGYYSGPTSGSYFNLGLLIPLVDIGLKAEVRGNVYGGERVVITTGLGAILFF